MGVEEVEEVVKMGRTTGGSGSVPVVGNNNNTLFPAYGYDTEEGVVHNVVASSSSSSYSQSQVQVRRTHAVPVAASAATASAALPSSDCIKVIVRIRPPLSRELNGPRTYRQAFAIEQGRRGEWSSGGSSDALTLSENLSSLASGGILDGVVYNSYRCVIVIVIVIGIVVWWCCRFSSIARSLGSLHIPVGPASSSSFSSSSSSFSYSSSSYSSYLQVCV